MASAATSVRRAATAPRAGAPARRLAAATAPRRWYLDAVVFVSGRWPPVAVAVVVCVAVVAATARAESGPVPVCDAQTTYAGRCDGDTAHYCDDRYGSDMPVSEHCGSLGGVCLVVVDVAARCAMPIGAPCLVTYPREEARPCGDAAGLFAGAACDRAQGCVADAGACDAASFAPTCEGDVLVHACSAFAQKTRVDCASRGLACTQSGCRGVVEGGACREGVLTCADGLVCVIDGPPGDGTCRVGLHPDGGAAFETCRAIRDGGSIACDEHEILRCPDGELDDPVQRDFCRACVEAPALGPMCVVSDSMACDGPVGPPLACGTAADGIVPSTACVSTYESYPTCRQDYGACDPASFTKRCDGALALVRCEPWGAVRAHDCGPRKMCALLDGGPDLTCAGAVDAGTGRSDAGTAPADGEVAGDAGGPSEPDATCACAATASASPSGGLLLLVALGTTTGARARRRPATARREFVAGGRAA